MAGDLNVRTKWEGEDLVKMPEVRTDRADGWTVVQDFKWVSRESIKQAIVDANSQCTGDFTERATVSDQVIFLTPEGKRLWDEIGNLKFKNVPDERRKWHWIAEIRKDDVFMWGQEQGIGSPR